MQHSLFIRIIKTTEMSLNEGHVLCLKSARIDWDYSVFPCCMSDTFIVLLLLAEVDCQSKLFFSSVAAFSLCNGRGALSQGALLCMSCLLQIRGQKLSKTGRNAGSHGIQRHVLWLQVQFCVSPPPHTDFAARIDCILFGIDCSGVYLTHSGLWVVVNIQWLHRGTFVL